MIRVMISIERYSTFLSTSCGTAEAEHLDWRKEETVHSILKVARCHFSYAKAEIKYSRIEEYQKGAFITVKNQMDQMINSYMRGMRLAPHDHSFIFDSVNMPLNEWLERQRNIFDENIDK